MSTFKSVVTTLGQSRIAAAIAAGTDINITQLAVGDGNGKATTPVATQTQLVKEVYRTPLNSLKLDPSHANWIIAEAVISASVGGFWMREMGLFADDGALIAVCNMADTYKPTLAEGSGRTQTLRMVIAVSNTEAISLLIDDSVIMATEQYVNDLLAAHEKSRNHPDGTLTDKGFVQLSNSVTSDSESLAATPKAVKAANDNANGRLPSDGTAQAASKLATARKVAGVDFDGTKDISITAADVGALPADGTAAAATKLATARKIAGVDFDGTKDISITAAGVGALPAAGTAAAATKLATVRKIAGVDFDGTKDISITAAGVGALPAAGTAAAATKLATARKIAGIDFDGTKDISITAAGVGALPAAGTAAAATKLATARKIAGIDFDGTKDISITAAGVGAFPAQGGTVGGDGVSTPYLAVTGFDWMTKNGNYASGNDYQTNWTRINGRSGSDAKVDVYHYESTGNYHSIDFHVFGGGNEGYFNHRNDGTFFCTGPLIGAAATANGHAVNLAQLNAAAAKRALLAGSTVQTFDVAQAASWGHAVRLDQFQSGSNGNGAWVKLPNGPQWCRQNLSLPANTITTWTFPAGFSGTPALFISTFNGELKAWFNGASGSGANIYNASNSAVNVNLLAIW